MEKEAALLESEKEKEKENENENENENEDLCSFYEDNFEELYSSCGSDTCGDGSSTGGHRCKIKEKFKLKYFKYLLK